MKAFGRAVLGLVVLIGTVVPVSASANTSIGYAMRWAALPDDAPAGSAASVRASTVDCYTYAFVDPAHDTVGGLDIVKYSLSYDCSRREWVFRLRASRSFASSEIGFIGLAIDADLRQRNNCGGVERELAVTWSPSRRKLIGGIVYFNGSCRNTRLGDSFRFSREDGPRTLTLRFKASALQFGSYDPPLDFNWFAFATSRSQPLARDWDNLPNRGYFLARGTASGMFTDPESGVGAAAINGSNPTATASGDFNADGFDDLVVFRRGGQSELRFGGRRGFVAEPLAAPAMATQVVSADFDGNGKSDLAFYEPGLGTDSIWYSFAAFLPGPLDIDGRVQLRAGDFDGDGFGDLLLARSGTGSDQIRWGSGFGPVEQTDFAIDDVGSPTVGDFDGDGRDEVVLWSAGVRRVRVVHWDAARSMAASSAAIGGRYRLATAGDFNTDGRDDLLFNDGSVNADALWLGSTAPPYFASGPPTIVNEAYVSSSSGDYNFDGASDVWFLGDGGVTERVWRGTPAPATIVGGLSPATVGSPYVDQLQATGGSAPYTWSAAGLPEGLAIASDGVVSGSPLDAGTFAVRTSARTALGSTSAKTVQLVVAPLPMTELPIRDFVTAAVFDEETGRFFLTGNGPLVVLDSDGEVIAELVNLYGAGGLALHEGIVYVSLPVPDQIVMVDATSLEIIGQINTGSERGDPSALRIVNGRLWFVHDFRFPTGEALSWYELETGVMGYAPIYLSQTTKFLAGPAARPTEVFTGATAWSAPIQRIDLSDPVPQVLASYGDSQGDYADCVPPALVPSSDALVTVCRGDRLLVLDGETLEPLETWALPDQSWRVASTDAAGGWIAIGTGSSLRMFRAGEQTPRRTLTDVGPGPQVVFGASSSRVLVLSQGNFARAGVVSLAAFG